MKTFHKKSNQNNDSLIQEAHSINLISKNLELSNNSYINTPIIIQVSNDELIIEYIDSKYGSNSQMVDFAKGLAKLHAIKQEYFGFDRDNYIGLGIQKNIITNNWGNFFIDYRLSYQISIIKDKKIQKEFEFILETKRDKLVDFLNSYIEQPSLLHGDLWSGNVLFDDKNIYLIDPASYYGDREVDIAMTEMFGGFSNSFYQTYNDIYPLSKNYKDKKIIFNLYHYLNHYNLFGNSYLNSTMNSFSFLNKL